MTDYGSGYRDGKRLAQLDVHLALQQKQREIDLLVEALMNEKRENAILREALRPFADKYLWPDDAGEYVTDTIREDEDWSEIANDETVDDVWIKRGDIRRARAALGESK